MAERPHSRILLAILTLIALVLITLDYRQGDDGALTTLRRGALIAFAPIQDGFTQAVRPLENAAGSVSELWGLRDRNRRLEAELERLEAHHSSVADTERENAELRALLRMRDRYELETAAARVISHAPGDRGNTVVIDTGADAGVETGMAVVGTRGLIGKITVTTSRYAWVELLTSPAARYAVRVAETGERGLLRGQGADPFRMELLEFQARVPEGSEIVTHTFQGSTIPDGIPVGEVVDRDPAHGQVSPRYHLVSPYVDFRRLSTVQVVLNAPEPPAAPDPDDVIEPGGRDRPDAGGDGDGDGDGGGDGDADGGGDGDGDGGGDGDEDAEDEGDDDGEAGETAASG